MTAIFVLIFWCAYITGIIYTAPRFTAEEAHRRGRLHVQYDDAIYGIARSAAWPIFGMVTYTQAAAEKKLSKIPDVRYARAIEASKRSDELDQALTRQLEENHE